MKHKLIPYEELPLAVDAIRKQPGVKIVLTNGCFDLLHPGHIFSLTYAKSLGEILIVLVNTDDYVQKMKGIDRPYFDLKNRLFMVGSLEPVTIVTPLRDSNVIEALEMIKPDIWVKGEDYTLETLNQNERKVAEYHNIKIEFSPLLPGVSSTEVIKTIKENAIAAYEQKRFLEGENDIADGLELPDKLNDHFKKIVSSTVKGSSNTYEKESLGNPLTMPDVRCKHREEQVVINKHCGCKKKKLYCNFYKKFINLRQCISCIDRLA